MHMNPGSRLLTIRPRSSPAEIAQAVKYQWNHIDILQLVEFGDYYSLDKK